MSADAKNSETAGTPADAPNAAAQDAAALAEAARRAQEEATAAVARAQEALAALAAANAQAAPVIPAAPVEPAAQAEPAPAESAPAPPAPEAEADAPEQAPAPAAQASAPATPPATPAAQAPPAQAPGAPLTAEQAEAIRAGYTLEGPALDIGALMNGEPDPSVQVRIPLAMMNRHGLVAGATGTGKTRTLQGLTEQLSAHGVPVFAADIKGDLSGVATPGEGNEKLLKRTSALGQDWTPASFPVEYFSLGGVGTGVPIRATIAGFGPTLLSKVLGLNPTQESSLGLVFHYADKAGLALLDLSDLRAVLTFLASDEGKAELKDLGGLSAATVGVILRELITFADRGADRFFGEPEIDAAEFLRVAADGRGIISLLEVPGVQDQPALYSTFLMWLLAELFHTLPEVGDLDKPKLVFFFDEAHLLFTDASKDFLSQVVQTVRLIRSKGVGIFFVTQTPKDVPADVLAQLGSRVQHALRAFTPDDAKALKATVSTYPKSGYDLAEVLQAMGTGEAVVTVMNEKGAPSPVAWTRLRAPQGRMDPTPTPQIEAAIAASPLLAKYGTAIDRESAREILTARLDAAHAQAEATQAAADQAKIDAEYAKQQAAIDKAQEAARKKADAEYERLLKKTAGTGRSTKASPPKNVLEEVLGSKATKNLLTGVVEGIFGTRRRR
ncbi:DUF853 family protein [Mycetocola tolaasinivorans]|uniref:DUF853 family protein n=1 Tax=Mycetocola tolaasinivorans TaxID=76635 RepID=A0A3L7A481_9MICO|nr:helicase HerA-like domain-containing protein [Mycetocola tolaasinivorans]RLP74092.1 DUF853 family protein [Mycetocola tolaasinivorans]